MTIYAETVTPVAKLEKLIINTEFHTCFLLIVGIKREISILFPAQKLIWQYSAA